MLFGPNKMEKIWVLILVLFFARNSLDKAEAVHLEELPLQTFDELFVEEWWDNDKAEELDKLTLEHNLHHQIDRQNTQFGQIEPNSNDQNPPLTESDHSGQIEPNSTDQTPPLIESDHSDNANSSENIAENEQKRQIVDKFHTMKDEFKQKGKYSAKERTKIEDKIAKHLKVSRTKIYEWKKEFGLSRINSKNKQKNLVEKFDQRKAELKRDGFKNSYHNQINEIVAKELGLSFRTIYAWKRKLGQSRAQHKHSHSEQNELMKRYYKIKDKNPNISDEDIVKSLNIALRTLIRWKKQFQPNAVDEHSVEENAAANVQKIGNSNSGSI